MSAWGRALEPPQFILKYRERINWETQTIKGPRSVWRWSRWQTKASFGWEAQAKDALDAQRAKGGGLKEWAIFHRGRRV